MKPPHGQSGILKSDERQFSLWRIPGEMSKRRMPKRNYTTIWRWATKGIVIGDRKVELETVSVAGRLYTSIESVSRFFLKCRSHHGTRIRQSRQKPTAKPARTRKNLAKRRRPLQA